MEQTIYVNLESTNSTLQTMKIKIFVIDLASEQRRLAEESELNTFLSRVKTKRIDTALLPNGSQLSVVVVFDDALTESPR